jgi:hypothetical protein
VYGNALPTSEYPVESVGGLFYWIRKGTGAISGYAAASVHILVSGGYDLEYYHGFDGSHAMGNSVIDLGDTSTNTWVQISRDLYLDLITKFGPSIQSQTITGIKLCSTGYYELGQKRGQRVNWDDIYLENLSS